METCAHKIQHQISHQYFFRKSQSQLHIECTKTLEIETVMQSAPGWLLPEIHSAVHLQKISHTQKAFILFLSVMYILIVDEYCHSCWQRNINQTLCPHLLESMGKHYRLLLTFCILPFATYYGEQVDKKDKYLY